MFDKMHYVPVLKWRQGEYQALFNLQPGVKDYLTPLFELPTEGWDFEKEEPAKTIDDHLGKFGSRLKQKWDTRRCFVDSPFLDSTACVANGVHHFEHVFDLVRAAGANAVPVTGLGRDPAYQAAVKTIVAKDEKGACIRLAVDDFEDTLHTDLGALLKMIGANVAICDLVIDCAEDVSVSAKTQAIVWKGLLDQIPAISDWRSLTVTGTAFPPNLPSGTYRPHGTIARADWLGYKALLSALPKGSRVPTFGDYCVSHPKTELMDPRMLDPNAKVKYTITDAWFIAMGTQVKKNGRGQYAGVCGTIVSANPPVFMGAPYSYGDKYIDDCANHGGSTGGTSTWPTVATNHHVTKVVRDVATLFGALVLP
jgi:Beta protein